MATETPSTTAENPLQNSLARITGQDPLSQSAGTSSLISYDDTSAGFRNPQGDVISIKSSPGTGASTAETWSHEVALENLKRDQLEFQYTQQQNEIANALRQAENLRSIEASKRAQQEFEMNREMTRAQMANMAATQQMQREQSAREQAEFIQKTAHDPSYYTSGQAVKDTRAELVKRAGAQGASYGGPSVDWYVSQGYLKPSEVGAYNAAYQQQRAMQQTAGAISNRGWQQGAGSTGPFSYGLK
jgi:hypothetical protein